MGGMRGRKAGRGRFEGGRKALSPDDPNRRVKITPMIPAWLRDWLKVQQVSQGRLIEQALVEQFKIQPGQDS